MVHHQSPDLAALFRAHLPKVLRAVRQSGVAARDAEDVAQDVFVIVNRALVRYDFTRPIEPWLLTITHRTARDYRAKAQRREDPTEEIDGEDFDQDPERSALAREAGKLFVEIVAEVEESYREVYLLAEIDGLTTPEIAAALDIPIGTAASRLARGRASFDAALERRRLADQHPPRRTAAAAFLPVLLGNPAAILDAARRLPVVAAATAERIWSRVTASIATAALAGIGAAGLAYTARQMLAGMVGALLIGATSGGGIVYALTHGSAASSSVATVAVAEPTRGPSGEAVPVDVVEDAKPVAAPPVASVAPVLAVAPVAVSASAPSTDRAELALLDRARTALARGDNAGALTVLQRHKATYPRGVYSVERDALILRANARVDGQTGDPR